ncbi:uncharacterized protein LOC108340764 isoform X2 [Vigna angularis]|uniref:uncharacterized protein LOC108340764 isoform X2 n=2 Tax=Phaseolus angularis TaxID=3914 RepID=UPI0022B2FC8F|nr:uncharacterized protein LOC108340764 isoform X2 [Vigna angularis]
MSEVKIIGVVGGGQMGSGIAQVAAMHGVDVFLHDLDHRVLSKASSSISSSIDRFVSKGTLSQAAGVEVFKRLRFTTNLEDFHTADFIIEAIVESEDVKKSLFVKLDKIAKSSAIFASNTSSISITRIASSTTRPRQVIGMHFMNPPPLKKLIEIIRGADTSDETFATTKALSERLGKVVITSQDYSGFIVNRILMPMINEAFFTLYTGVGTKEDIDRGMKLGTSHPMGPLELADFIGLDVCLSIMRVLHAGLGDNKYAPCPLLVQYVDAGRLGRKRGLQNLTFPHMSDCWDGADCSNTLYYADKTKESLEEDCSASLVSFGLTNNTVRFLRFNVSLSLFG